MRYSGIFPEQEEPWELTIIHIFHPETELQKHIVFGYTRISVEHLIPKPKQWDKVGRLGHTTKIFTSWKIITWPLPAFSITIHRWVFWCHFYKAQNDVNNFKPISLLNVFSKLIRSMVKAKLNQCLEDYHISLNNCVAYRKHRSVISCFNQLLLHISVEKC